MKQDKTQEYLKVIDEIEKVRTKNNINWMDILRIAISHAPEETTKVMKNINLEDKAISKLFEKLSN
tara:strand:+ start:212 stop:409 length:198 start_codon:yes stop_codon:yes gene_type:complete